MSRVFFCFLFSVCAAYFAFCVHRSFVAVVRLTLMRTLLPLRPVFMDPVFLKSYFKNRGDRIETWTTLARARGIIIDFCIC